MWWPTSALIFGILLLPYTVECGKNERRLFQDLFKYYNKLERPVVNESLAVGVNIGLILQQLVDLDEEKGVLTTNAWLNLEWTDENLRWNASEYGGIKDIRLPTSLIWTPDIMLYNNANYKVDETYQTMVVVSSDGNCLYFPPRIFKSTCKVDKTSTEQRCNMKFGSWTYSGEFINLDKAGDSGDLSSYISNEKWEMIAVSAARNEVYYSCCPEAYQDVTFTIHIKKIDG